jgi:probable F420-dependent oxidoreductase
MTAFGISTYDYAPEDMMAFATHAERVGFDSLWFGEHYVVPEHFEGHHPSRTDTPKELNDTRDKAILSPDIRIYDPFSLLSTIVGATTRLKVGTAICIVPMNHPLLLARQLATIQAFSGGRFLFGTGAGWLKEEFDAVGVPFKERGARMDEMFEIIRKALAGGFFSHQGKYFQFDSLQITQNPVTVPLVCGGNSGPALRRVAQIADAWINSAMVTIDEAVSLRATIEAERAARGTAGRPFAYYVRPHTVTPEEIDSFKRQGFDNIVLWGQNLWPNTSELTLSEKIAWLERVAKSLRIGDGG